VIAPAGDPQLALEWCEEPLTDESAEAADSLPFDR